MRVTTRAATMLAAAVTLTATAYAGPSLAWDVEAAPMVPITAAHGAASINGSSVILNAVTVPTESSADTNFATPVVTHAVATLEEESDEAEETPEAKSRSLQELVSEFASADAADEEQRCLAGAVYFESKGEPLQGQLAVAEVIINRAESGRFPSTFCGVVKQRGQFSFVRGGRIPAIPTSSANWRKAVAIAKIAQEELAESKVSDALFFHARRVSPGWKRLKRVATVGNHVFYR